MVQRLSAAFITGVSREMQGIYESVAAMKLANLATGTIVVTLANSHGIPCESMWKIGAADATTFSHQLTNGKSANLMPRSHEEYASFDYGHRTDGGANIAAANKAHEVARNKSHMCELAMPAGAYPINDTLLLNVNRRHFRFTGKGWDASWVMYKGPAHLPSVHLPVVSPQGVAQDRNHFYQVVDGFSVDGGMEVAGGGCAGSVVIGGHYARCGLKSVGHFFANFELTGLVQTFYGHSQGRTSPDGRWFTRVGIDVAYNSIKLIENAYVGGASKAACTVKVDGAQTTLAVATVVGATTITVADASKMRPYQIVEIRGGSKLEAKVIQSINGNVLTIATPMEVVHPVGGGVIVPVFGTSVNGCTIETGEMRIGNCTALDVSGNYFEGASLVFTGYPINASVRANTILEVDCLINEVNPRSRITIRDNHTAFSIRVAVRDRSGGVSGILDLSRMPYLDIGGNDRSQASILVNSTYSFKELKVTDAYDTVLGDNIMKQMEFKGLFYNAPVGVTANALEMFQLQSAGESFNGYTYDLNVTMRRDTSVVPGYAKVAGITGVAGSATTQQTDVLTAMYAHWNTANGVSLAFGASTSRGTVTVKGEPSGGQATKMSISGTITSIR